jgi:hypothetical protein
VGIRGSDVGPGPAFVISDSELERTAVSPT